MQFHRSKDVTGGVGAWFLAACMVLAAALIARGDRVFMPHAWIAPQPFAGDLQIIDEAGETGSEITGAASLPTDDNVDRKLRKAQEYLAQKRYDLAITVWQEILNGSEQFMRKRDVVRTDDGEYPIFDSVHASIEEQLSLLAKNAPQGMKEYRLKADADARELIAQARGKDEERALAEVVRRYFFSSLGDDAAYTLGCLMLDRHEFVAASRLFLDMVARHPDYAARTDTPPVTPRDEVLLRAAVASARGGDVKTAKLVLEELKKSRSTVASGEILGWLERTTSKGGGKFEGVANLPGDWPMAYGAATRDRSMPGLPADTAYRGVWSPLWVVRYNEEKFGLSAGNMTTPPTPVPVKPADPADPISAAAQSKHRRDIYDGRRKEMARRWESSDRMPADQIIMAAGRLYFRAYDRVVCVEGRTGRTLFATRPSSVPQVQIIGNTGGTYPEEVVLFADRTFSAMSVADGVLYYLEDDQSAPLPQDRAYFQAHGISAMPPRFGNRIVAVDARNGKLQWTSANEPDKAGNRASVRYLAAPVAYGNLLLVPAIENNSLYLYARRADAQGALAWKTELAGVPSKGDSPWVTTGIAVAGGDAYLCHGGIVFNVDAAAGHVRWAVRYARAASGGMNPNYGQSVLSTKGFDDDYLVPFGRGVVVAAHDCDELFALDRRTGRLLWETPRQGMTHVIGVLGQSLYVASSDTVRRFGLISGAEESQPAELGEHRLTGRGFISADGLYLPSKSAIFRRHPTQIDRVLSTVGTALTIRDSSGAPDYWDPVGNLYSDGKRLYSASLERVYALGDAAKLKPAAGAGQTDDDAGTAVAKPSTGDANMDLLQTFGVEPDAAGIRAFLQQLHPDEAAKKQAAALLAQLGDDDYDKRQDAEAKLRRAPVPPIEALTAMRDGTDDAEVKGACERLLAATGDRRTRLLYAAFATIRIQSIKGLAEPIIKAAPFCSQPYLMDALSRSLAVTSSPADAAALRAASGDASALVRRAAAVALAAALKADAKADLDQLARDGDEGVRLAAARGMANLGDRDCLGLLVALLESEAIEVRGGAGRALASLTGQSIAFVAYDKPENRRIAIDKWKAWITAHGKTASLKYPLVDSKLIVGRTLICNYRMNRVVEVDAEGKETWSVQATNPWAAIGLPNGHRLIASYAGTVTEYNAAGESIWQHGGLPAPFAVERLDNGNTLVACANGNRIVEIAPDKSTVRNINMVGRPTSVQALENGNLLVALQHQNRVVEIDTADKIVWQLDNITGAIGAQRLSNGHTLVVESSANRVREFDADKKETAAIAQAEGQPLAMPYHAQRLENGHTLITDRFGVRELDAGGKVVWKRAEQWISRASRY